MIIRLEEVMQLRGGENGHLRADLLTAVDESGTRLGLDLYTGIVDKGQRTRKPGWTNIGDISACLRAIVGLDDIYGRSDAAHIVTASKHTRPVILAKGTSQLETVKKALAGDINSPFGGVWALNKPLEYETAQFLDRIFLEGIIAPEFESGTVELLSGNERRFLIEAGYLRPADLDTLGFSLQQVACGYFLKQEREKPFDPYKEAAVVRPTGDTSLTTLDARIVDDIGFAGNAAIYLSSNLVFYVHNGAIAGLGDGCGSRVVAATKARSMLEVSVYGALSANDDKMWDALLYGTKFTREDFEGLEVPLRLTAFSDAFFPEPDGYVETSGLDRIHPEFGRREVLVGRDQLPFIPKRNNYNPDYDRGLIPKVVVQPGGAGKDRQVRRMAKKYEIPMVFTMSPELFDLYRTNQKDPATGKKPTGRRFFGHNIMS